jgi:hypothetical protein
MPYPQPIQNGIDIFHQIYDTWCILGVLRADTVYNPVQNDYDDIYRDDPTVSRRVQWINSNRLANQYIEPIPCKIDFGAVMPDINGSTWINPLENSLCTLFCPPPVYDIDLELCMTSNSFVVKQFILPRYTLGTVFSDDPNDMSYANLMVRKGLRYSSSSYPILYDDHMELDCIRG